MNITDNQLNAIIKPLLLTYNQHLLELLDKYDIDKKIKNENVYLLCGINNIDTSVKFATRQVERWFQKCEEGILGEFFEDLMIEIITLNYTTIPAPKGGNHKFDVIYEKEDDLIAIQIKSSWNSR